MASVSGSLSFSAYGTDQYTYTVTYSVTWTSGSTSRSTSPASGFTYPTPVSCGSNVTAYINWSETISGVVTTGSDPITGTAPACPVSYPPVWTDAALAPFQATAAYSDGVTATNMSYSGYYFLSSGSLPAGISLNSSTGAVTGTPGIAGQSYSFLLGASNSYGTIYQSFSGTVAAAPTAGKIRTWNGTAWVYGPVKVWNGTSWVTGTVKVWNGTAWVTSV